VRFISYHRMTPHMHLLWSPYAAVTRCHHTAPTYRQEGSTAATTNRFKDGSATTAAGFRTASSTSIVVLQYTSIGTLRG
jgi:hypothetical protein